MGVWITLHLFDPHKFQEETVPLLLGEKDGLRKIYSDFLQGYHIGGIDNISLGKLLVLLSNGVKNIHRCSQLLESALYNLHIDSSTLAERLREEEEYYEYCRFLEFLIFQHCADFFPHLPVGKSGICHKLQLPPHAVITSVLENLDNRSSLFCVDSMGIMGWLNCEEIELLFLSKDEIRGEAEYEQFANAIHQFIDIAHENSLGWVMGMDMRETQLEKLNSYKLIDQNKWKKYNSSGLLYKL